MELRQERYNPSIFMVILMLLTFSHGVNSSICDDGMCKCYPLYGNATIVDCRCSVTQKGFDFSESDFGKQFNMVRDFSVTNCDGDVMFRTNAFRDLGKLENVYLEKVGRVEFESGVFQSLNNLNIYDIQELKFGDRAFMGAQDLRSIKMRRVTIPRLHSHSLFDIRGLHSLELDEIELRHVDKDAVKIDFIPSELSYFLINNCTIGHIESKGIILKAKNFSMMKSDLEGLSSKAVDINSSELILISESNFGSNLWNNFINMVAPEINIRSNIFKFLPGGIMESIKFENSQKLIFTNNTVYNIGTDKVLDVISSLFKTAEFKDNHFPCTCSIRVLNHDLREFNQNNFCISKCNISLSDFNALVVDGKLCSLNSSELDVYESCASLVSSTPNPRHGRIPSYFRTTQMTTKVDKAINGSERMQILPVLFLFILFAVIS